MESNEAMNDFILFTKKTNRYLLIILTVLLCFTLVSCGNTDSRFDEAKIPLGLNVQDNRNYPSTSVQEDGERGTVAISTDNLQKRQQPQRLYLQLQLVLKRKHLPKRRKISL